MREAIDRGMPLMMSGVAMPRFTPGQPARARRLDPRRRDRRCDLGRLPARKAQPARDGGSRGLRTSPTSAPSRAERAVADFFEPFSVPLQLKVRQATKRLLNPTFNLEPTMHAIRSLITVAALIAAGTAAAADNVIVKLDDLSQSQSGSDNTQSFEVGSARGAISGNSSASLVAANVRQAQSGASNNQSLEIAKVSKRMGGATVSVMTHNVAQEQSGSRNRQSLKLGVVADN
jgi:hypothetical protein